MKIHRFILILLAGVAISACGVLPRYGPSAGSVSSGANGQQEAQAGREFALIKIDPANVRTLGKHKIRDFSNEMEKNITGKPTATLDVGDQILITVWETGQDGLFSTKGKTGASINATIDENGKIYMPYVGEMKLGGMSISKARNAIEAGLSGKALDAQVQLELSSKDGHKISILGDVKAPRRMPIPPSGLRLSEALATAGGTTSPSFESLVSVSRGSKKASAHLDDVIGNPKNDVWLAPRDIVQVRHKPRSFSAFGAVVSPGNTPFMSQELNLSKAIAQVGGLHDNWADTGGVFLFRLEDPKHLEAAGISPLPTRRTQEGKVATVYQLNFAAPDAFFLASDFAVRDGDILYVANASGAEFRKFALSFITPIFSTAQVIDSMSN